MTATPRVGIGFDAHRLVKKRTLVLGGVMIPHEKGLLGHSDADVLSHAVADAILGALGRGDIGQHFPDHNPAYKDISSLKLLERIRVFLEEDDASIIWIDAVIIAQKPKLQPYFEAMKVNIAGALKIGTDRINIKATTTERLGFTGREEGMAAQVTATLSVNG